MFATPMLGTSFQVDWKKIGRLKLVGDSTEEPNPAWRNRVRVSVLAIRKLDEKRPRESLSSTRTEFCQLKLQSRSGVSSEKTESRVLPVSGIESSPPRVSGTTRVPSGDLKLF